MELIKRNARVRKIEVRDPNYTLPTVDVLNDYLKTYSPSKEYIEDMKVKIVRIFKDFDVDVTAYDANVGPIVTQYEFTPNGGTRLAKIRGLEEDMALHLGASGVRILQVKGKPVIAVEVPNAESNIVGLKNVINSDEFKSSKMDLPIALGETATGEPFIVDLTKAPHILIGGATGQGKSVGINVMLSSLLFNKQPNELKLMLIDVKKVELDVYNQVAEQFKCDFSNKLVLTEIDEITRNLDLLTVEMDRRYDLLMNAGCRNIKQYNEKWINGEIKGSRGHKYLPYIVTIIDEFSDLMMKSGPAVEASVTRIAQLARAVGIHLVVATQRPSADVITGNIKANFPTRIAFTVATGIDSRTILDMGGAQNLVGKGDMLYSKGMDLVRAQSAYVEVDELENLVNSISNQ